MLQRRVRPFGRLRVLVAGLLLGTVAATVSWAQQEEETTRVRVKTLRLDDRQQAGQGDPQWVETREKRIMIVGDSEEGLPAGDRHVVVVRTTSGDHGEMEVHAEALAGDDGLNVFQWAYETAPSNGGYLGVEVLAITDALRRHFNSPLGVGVLVADVEAESPAAEMGLDAGDVVTKLDEQPVASTHHFGREIRSRQAGDTLTLEVWRNGSSVLLEAVLDERRSSIVELGSEGKIVRIEGPVNQEIHFDLEGAATEIREVLASGEWKSKVDHLRTIDVEALEERIRQLEEQLRRLQNEPRP